MSAKFTSDFLKVRDYLADPGIDREVANSKTDLKVMRV